MQALRFDAGRLPAEILTRIGKYGALGLAALALVYKICQVFAAQRWNAKEIARNIQKGIPVESWRQSQLLFPTTFPRVGFSENKLMCFSPSSQHGYLIDQNPFLTRLKLKIVFSETQVFSSPPKTYFENEKMRYVFTALADGSFELEKQLLEGDQEPKKEIFPPIGPADSITACAYEAGQIFIARGKNIGRFDLEQRLEVRNWLKWDHEITGLSFYNGQLYAAGPTGLTAWDFRRKTQPGIIDQIFDRVLRFFG